MSFAADALKTLKDVVLMNERIENLTKATEGLEAERRDMHDRLVRVEVFIELLREANSRRALPPM